ncbi:succinate dehydrogenase iron-sulfur subunit [Desulfotomaculum defluvii]
MSKQVSLKIKRQLDANHQCYWEEFIIPYKEKMNVISLLMEIQKKPVNAKGEPTTPVIWECNCLEEVCGACTMVINGKARQACSALVDQLQQPIVLEPLSKFPIVRDLMVDRSIMFENLKKVKAWIPIDGTHNLGPGPRMAQKIQEESYPISRCMTCGCCMEACPNVNEKSKFMGPAPLAQTILFNSHPTGFMNREERLDAVMGEGGVTDCGNSQNCVKVCPKQIPLTKNIAQLNRDTIVYGIKRWLNR